MTKLLLSKPGSNESIKLFTAGSPEKLFNAIVCCIHAQGDESYVYIDNNEKDRFTILPKRMLLDSIIHIEEAEEVESKGQNKDKNLPSP